MPNKPRKLSELVKLNELFPDTERISDYEDQELEIQGFTIKSSKRFGEFATIKAKLSETGEELNLRTTSSIIIEELKDIGRKNGYPVIATFVQQGQGHRLV